MCFKTNRALPFLILIAFFITFLSKPVFSCNLADHDWQLLGKITLPTNSPLLPLAEIDISSRAFTPAQINQIVWLAKIGPIQSLFLGLRGLSGSWLAKLPWLTASFGEDVSKTWAGKHKEKTLFIKSDNYILKAAFYSDQNSKNRCFDLIILEEGRIRLMNNNVSKPFVGEFKGATWLSIKFWNKPSFSNVLSITFYPWKGHSTVVYENTKLADKLLNNNSLMRRTDAPQNEILDDFPNL